MKALLVAGTHSGVGKTSVTVGLMAALRRRGLVIQPFKVGPDFIDPAHHGVAAGRVSRNLDGWMLSKEANIDVFARNAGGADVCVVEGVMGLFDGRDGISEEGSTAQMAKWLSLPVVLVVDAFALSRSAGAVVKGFSEFDPELRIAGVVFNRVGSATHLQWLTDAVRWATAVDVLGGIPNDPEVSFPERHLGLVMPDEERTTSWIERMADLIEDSVDVDKFLEMSDVPLPRVQTAEAPAPPARRARIGVMRDEAFCFYYQDNLDLLRSFGAELIELSALRDRLPADLDGLYIGGGYPELLAAELSANRSLIEDVRLFASTGHPIYGECGGLMYLSQGIEDGDGARHPLCGLFPVWTRLTSKPTIAYVEVQTVGESIFPRDEGARGHVFHYSEMVGAIPSSCSYLVKPTHGERFQEGFRTANVLASYVHLHFLSNPAFAESFVTASSGSS